MCGIVGSFMTGSSKAAVGETVLAAMRDRMVHRGPDGGDLWYSRDGICGFGHRRLAIIDLSTNAFQPMANETGEVCVTFNGEIYNHAEIRKDLEALGKYQWKTDHSDTEVLLRAYEEWGLDAIKRFVGMFAFAIYDGRDRDNPKVHMVRDRIGKKPLYFSRTSSGEWIFASEIRALMVHPDMSAEMEPAALWHYLTFIVTPAPLTLFKGVFKLPPAHILTVDSRGNARAHRYWECLPSKEKTLTEKDISFDEAAAELSGIFKKAIARRMVSDVPFGVLLSGGVDSSLNVALMAEMMDRPVTTFTVGYSEYGDFNEFDHARRIAQRYGTDHHEVRIDSAEAMKFFPLLVELQDEPIADNVCIPLYFLSKLVRDSGTTVVQVGEGADENFLGYWWCQHYLDKYNDVYEPARKAGQLTFWQKLMGRAPRMPMGNDENAEIRRRAVKGQELFWGGAVAWWGSLRDQLTPDPGPYRSKIDCPVPGLLPPSFEEQDSHNIVANAMSRLGDVADPEILQKITHMELSLRLPEHLLMRVDKMTMAHSIEARVPFLDPDVVEFAMRLPLSYKLGDGTGKRILKKVAEPYIDHDLIYRKKQGFGAPMDKWFTEDRFGKKCLAAYERSSLRKQGFFDDAYLHGLLKAQVEGRINYGFHLWTVMNAVLWHEHWIDGGIQDF